MKRDMDLVRKILFAMEEHKEGFAPEKFSIDGYDEVQIGYHVMLMAQANLLVANDVTHMGCKAPYWLASHLTWEGHEFLDASRDENTWSKAKAAVSRAGGFSFDVVKAVLVKIAAEAAMAAL